MNHRHLASGLFALLPCAVANAQHGSPPSENSTRPNFLILLADDLGIDQLAAYGVGADLPKTPNIDAMAAQGVLFRRAWTNPVCSPSRAAMQTGRYGFRTGFGTVTSPVSPSLSLSETTLPELLRNGSAGAYRSAAIGKWHLSNDYVDPATGNAADPNCGGFLHPNLSGYDHYSGPLENLYCGLSVCEPPYWQGPIPYDYFHWRKIVDGIESVVDTYATTDSVDSALSWISQTQQPWLCYVAFNAAHNPFQAPPTELCDSGLVPGTKPAQGENQRPYYKAMIEAMDTEIGRLLASIDPETLARTTVIFLADNGTPQQVVAPPMISGHAKGTVYEGGINVPFIVSGAKVTGQGECQGLINASDIFATVAELAGVPLPSGVPLDSVSFAPYLSNPQLRSIRPTIFSELFAPLVAKPHCQENLGLAGPGQLDFTVCGEPLWAGNEAQLRIAGAPPHSLVTIVGSTQWNPTPSFGGTIGPSPVEEQWSFLADAQGVVEFTLPGGWPTGAGFQAYCQAWVADPSLPLGHAISNAVRIEFPHEQSHFRVVAIRNQRFKLIRVLHLNYFLAPTYPQEEIFLDLANDPGESDNLLLHPTLTPFESSQYARLDAQLDALLASE